MRENKSMTLLDFSFPITSQTVFDMTVARDWYDGLTSGITKSSRLRVAFRFEIIAWGPSQEKRVFAFSPLDIEVFDRIVELLPDQEAAKWPIWFPEWPIWQSVDTDEASEIKQLLSKTEPPQYAVASDSMFTTLLAAREFDSSSREQLPVTFDGSPFKDNFQYWKDFLTLSNS
jgi:hypothetical protein